MVQLAKTTKAYMFKYMNPSWIPEEELMSGKSMGDFVASRLFTESNTRSY